MTVHIRHESDRDADAIRAVTEAAFRDAPYASGDEQDIVDRLREAGALSVSLVAIIDDDIVGHVAFSPAESSDDSGPWFTLGPVSVVPGMQRQGIGSNLVRQGLEKLKDVGALGCILVGDPRFYKRFGFQPAPDLSPDPEIAPFFMLRCFASQRPHGPLQFHAAFSQ